MTRFILHIGPRATGAQSLQEAFAAASRPLADRDILYPPIWGERAHHELPERLARLDPKLERQFIELRECGYPAVLLSAEGLSELPAASIEYLRALILPRNPVRIVFYVRSWADLLAAHWRQSVMAGSTKTLPEYLLEWPSQPADSPVFNFAPVLRHYARRFGAHAIDIVCYDSVLAGHAELFRHFAAGFLDWPDPPALDVPPANVSPDAAQMEVVRALHGIERARLGRPPPPAAARAMAEHYLRIAATGPAPALQRALAMHEGTVPFEEFDRPLAQLHRDLFNEFRDAVAPPRPPGVFFTPRRADIACIQRGYLLAPGVAAELQALHRLLAQPQPADPPLPGR
jgi:hypothetical protein